MIIVQTKNFILESHQKPEVGRTDGGHLVINPKTPIEDRTFLKVDQIVELALLTNIAGTAMKNGLAEQGIILGRINYQDNGNWKPELHVHLYGRAVDATYQIYGEPIKTARTLSDKVAQEPLNAKDCDAIRTIALQLGRMDKYRSLELG
jgi:diadenosine tetraphosphate (Ap4A) HIT family hydrolase